jgi:hypothetical protein
MFSYYSCRQSIRNTGRNLDWYTFLPGLASGTGDLTLRRRLTASGGVRRVTAGMSDAASKRENMGRVYLASMKPSAVPLRSTCMLLGGRDKDRQFSGLLQMAEIHLVFIHSDTHGSLRPFI